MSTFACSYAQRHLWFAAQLEPESAAYNLVRVFEVGAGLNEEALRRALDALVSRHESLRTTFVLSEGEPVQRVHAPRPALMEVVDLGRETLRTQIAAETMRPFDLERGPLFRCVLYRVEDEGRVLLLAMHHLVSDAWSLGVLLRDLVVLYEAARSGGSLELPALPVQYADYACWQRGWLQGGVLEAELAHWRQRLAGAPQVLELPTDHPRPPVETNRGGALGFQVSREISDGLAAVCRREGVTLFMALLSAFEVLLSHLSGQDDLLVGTMIAGRSRAEVEGVVGLFTNTLVLRGDLSGNPTFRELLARVRETALDAYAHAEVPFEKVVGDLRPAPDLGRNPLFQAHFVLQDEGWDPPAKASLRLHPHPVERPGTQFDLALSFSARPEGLRGSFEYNRSLFDAATIEQWKRHLLLLLEAIVADPGRPIGELRRWLAEDDLEGRPEARDIKGPRTEPQRPWREAESITPAPAAGERPLSFAQERLWFLDRLQPGQATYNVPMAIGLEGELHVEALRSALQELVRRHESLRTTFVERPQGPVQVVRPSGRFELALEDRTGLDEDEQDTSLARRIHAEATRPFDLMTGPLFRALLVKLSATKHALVLNVHHIATDGWSMDVISKELAALYGAFRDGRPSPLAEPALQYGDYAVWQRAWLDEGRRSRLLGYWKSRLADHHSLELPTDHPRRALARHRGARVAFELPASLLEQVRRLGRGENATVFMVLLAAYQVLLHRYTGQTEISVGAPFAGRSRPELEGLVGFFVNTLVLRTDLSGAPPFREVLQRVRETTLEAFVHQDLPFEQLVSAVEGPRDTSRNPLVQTVFVLQTASTQPFQLPGLRTTPLPVETDTAKFDILVTLGQKEGGLVGTLEYDADLFETQTIERLCKRYHAVLEAVVSAPDQRITDLPLLSPRERQQILEEWNSTDTVYPRDSCVHDLFSEQAARTPGSVALEQGEKRLTYADLEARSNQLAHHLLGLGLSEGSLCAICAERSFDMIVALLGILKAGGAYCPLAPDYPKERLALMLDDSRAAVLLTETPLLSQLPDHPKVLCLDRDWPAVANRPSTPPPVRRAPDDLAYVMYTSGSTGTPKGVMVTHRGVTRLVFGCDYARFDESRVFLQLAPISFDAATLEIWGPLLHGGRCVLYPDARPEPATLERVLQEAGVTTLWLTASLYNFVIDERPQALASVEELLIGGEALSVPHVRKGLAALDRTRITNGYGPTESTTFATCHAIPRPLPGEVTAIPIGRPIGNTRVYILDGQFEPVPPGVTGEVYIGGDGLARGYHRRPALTAGRFVPNPFSQVPGARLYRTGDLARHLPDGSIDFLGRIDEQVKIRGFRIELGEIEAVLLAEPTVRSAAVVVRQTGAEKRLVAHLVAAAGAVPSTTQLRGYLASKLPEYMVPAEVVWQEALPLTPSGKVDRLALARSQRAQPQLGEGYVEPRTPTELLVAELMAQLLGVERVGSSDNFFELGGHSLLAARLASRIEEGFGVRLSIATILSQPRVDALANFIQAPGPDGVGPGMFLLRPGSKRSSVFIVPNVVGLFVYARRLASHIRSDHRAYCLTLPERDAVPFTFPRIEDLAAYWADRIVASHPEGPYHLVGHSFGGVVAFEIARQLQARSRGVGLLAILDTRPVSRSPVKLTEIVRGARGLTEDGWYILRHDLAGGTLFRNLSRAARGFRHRVTGGDPSVWVDDFVEEWNLSALPPGYAEVARTHLEAMTRYTEEPYAGRLTLIRAQRLNVFREFRRDLGWGHLAAGGVDVRIVPGDHLSIVEEPGVGVVGDHLTEALASAP